MESDGGKLTIGGAFSAHGAPHQFVGLMWRLPFIVEEDTKNFTLRQHCNKTKQQI